MWLFFHNLRQHSSPMISLAYDAIPTSEELMFILKIYKDLFNFYIRGSVHRESNLTLNPLTWKIRWAPNNYSRRQMGFNWAIKGLITVQQDVTVFSLLHFCRQLYMFRVLAPTIRSWYSCNYSFWYWLTGSTNIRSRCWVGTDSCVSIPDLLPSVLGVELELIHVYQYQKL